MTPEKAEELRINTYLIFAAMDEAIEFIYTTIVTGSRERSSAETAGLMKELFTNRIDQYIKEVVND